MKVRFAQRRSALLTPGQIACLQGTAGVNPAQGCGHNCIYCYARGYRNYPGDGRVVVYENLAEKLAYEIDHKRKLPRAVFFSPSTDAFQDVSEVQAASLGAMRTLLDAGIGISFLTKGRIDGEFFPLFRRHAHLVHAQIGITTLDRRVQQTLEPNAASPDERRENIRKLIRCGVTTDARIDPLVPRVMDTEDNLTPLFRALSELGVRCAGVSYLFLRPAITGHLRRALEPCGLFSELAAAYRDGSRRKLVGGEARMRLLPTEYRRRNYEQLRSIATRHGIRTFLCACKNPDLAHGLLCKANRERMIGRAARQADLFVHEEAAVV